MKSRMRDEEMRRRMRDEAKQAAPQKIRVNFDDDEDENTGTHATRGSGRNTENPNYATRGTYKKKSPSNTLYQIIKNQKGTQHWAERGFKTYRDYESDAKELIKENYPRWINKDYKGFYNASIFDNISEEKFNKLWFEEKVRQIRSREVLRKFIKRSRSKKNIVQVGQVKTMDDIREKFAQAKANNLLIEIDDSPKSIKAAPKKLITNVDDSDDSDHDSPQQIKKTSSPKNKPTPPIKKSRKTLRFGKSRVVAIAKRLIKEPAGKQIKRMDEYRKIKEKNRMEEKENLRDRIVEEEFLGKDDEDPEDEDEYKNEYEYPDKYDEDELNRSWWTKYRNQKPGKITAFYNDL